MPEKSSKEKFPSYSKPRQRKSDGAYLIRERKEDGTFKDHEFSDRKTAISFFESVTNANKNLPDGQILTPEEKDALSVAGINEIPVRWRVFIAEYLSNNHNATLAYKTAYHVSNNNVAAVNGHRLLKNAKVQEILSIEIDGLLAGLKSKIKSAVLHDMLCVATVKPGGWIEENGSIDFEKIRTEGAEALTGYEFEEVEESDGEGKSKKKRKVKFQTHRKDKAWDILARHVGIIEDKSENVVRAPVQIIVINSDVDINRW